MQKQLASLPTFKPLGRQSPELVRVLDKVRFGPLREVCEYDEFIWFIREYPRVYRHHYDHAEHRLRSLREAYQEHHAAAKALIDRNFDHPVGAEGTPSGYAYYDRTVLPIYWDFESYLQAVSITLDVAARVVGTAFKQGAPQTFNRFCKNAPEGELKDAFLSAQRRWVKRMKAYRDCFVHHTSIDTLLTMEIKSYPDAWELRGKLPINPGVHNILSFRYSRRVELLKYATTVWKHLAAFDRAIAMSLWRSYKRGTYPQEISRLF